MNTAYADASFLAYVELREQQATMVALDMAFDDDFDTVLQASYLALSVAVVSFVDTNADKPSHLTALQTRLLDAGLPADETAHFCIQVETLRVLSGWDKLTPLVNPSEPKNAVLNDVRMELKLWTFPVDGDLFALPMAADKRTEIAKLVFGGSSLASDLGL